MREIPLTKGRVTVVDEEDFEYLNQYKWYFGHGYAVRNAQNGNKRTTVRLHRLLLNARAGEQVDHINRNKLDNRKSNLRLVTQQENFWNTDIKKNNTSGFKGVHYKKRHNSWESSIWFNGKKYYLGLFKDKEKAALAYNEAAKSFRKGLTFLNPLQQI